MSHQRKVSPASSFYNNMEDSPKIPRQNIDLSLTSTCFRNKIWLAFFSLFVFWYLLIYGFDWSSLPGFSSISHDQDNSLQTVYRESLYHNASVVDDHDNVINNSSNNTYVSEENMEKPRNSSEDIDEIDVESLVKEFEPSLHDDKDDVMERKEPEAKTKVRSCEGRYIYMHDLPSRYNDDLLKNCKLLSKWSNMCVYLENMGLGTDLGNPQRTFSRNGWFNTNQFSLEVIFHNRMKQYECLTNDSSKAAAIFVPYYAGLDVSRYLWSSVNVSIRDSDSIELAKWLRGKPEWGVMGGRDHFLVAGRITWDFRRGVDNEAHWGNKLMLLPEFKNVTILTIESSPWNRNDFAIPYPTYFHPSRDRDVWEWQNRMRRQRRRTLYCFAGAPRPNMLHTIRGEIMDQCRASRRKCRLMECINERNKCQKPVNVIKMFQNSVFCLQPAGDSFTRRSIFDTILAGCIPVFFTPASAYVQYLWHLPKDFNKYSVLIPEDDVKIKTISIERELSKIPKSKVASMREEVIKLIPNVIYADPRSHLENLEDAFDLSVKGVVERVETLRKEIREGKNSSFEFDEEKSWKYFAFNTVDDHEWDHYFLRTDRGSYY